MPELTPEAFRILAWAYCLTFSASETSGYRTVEHNRAVGGVDGSPHTHGLGVDVVYDGSRPGDEADAWLAERQLRRLDEGDHDHVQPLHWINRPV